MSRICFFFVLIPPTPKFLFLFFSFPNVYCDLNFNCTLDPSTCDVYVLKLSFDISLSSFYSFSVKVDLRHDKSTHIYIPWWFCSYFLLYTHSCVNITAYWRATVWFSAETEVKILQSFDLTISWTAVIKFVVMFCFWGLS